MYCMSITPQSSDLKEKERWIEMYHFVTLNEMTSGNHHQWKAVSAWDDSISASLKVGRWPLCETPRNTLEYSRPKI